MRTPKPLKEVFVPTDVAVEFLVRQDDEYIVTRDNARQSIYQWHKHHRITNYGKGVRGQALWCLAELAVARDNPGEPTRYIGIHKRLRVERGVAKAHQCTHCPADALEWACKYGARSMSDDLSDYIPLCRKCHVALDRGVYKPL